MDSTVEAVINAAMDGSFEGGLTVGTLANNGVGIEPYHNFESAVPSELKAEIDAVRAGIIDGSISVGP